MSPACSAVAVVMSLNVDPGGWICWVERSSNGALSSFCSAVKAFSSADGSVETRSAGL